MERQPTQDHSPATIIAREKAIIAAIRKSLRDPRNMKEENRDELLREIEKAEKNILDAELFLADKKKY